MEIRLAIALRVLAGASYMDVGLIYGVDVGLIYGMLCDVVYGVCV